MDFPKIKLHTLLVWLLFEKKKIHPTPSNFLISVVINTVLIKKKKSSEQYYNDIFFYEILLVYCIWPAQQALCRNSQAYSWPCSIMNFNFYVNQYYEQEFGKYYKLHWSEFNRMDPDWLLVNLKHKYAKIRNLFFFFFKYDYGIDLL